MVVLKEQECYLWRITPSEKSMIHTDDGLRSVEVRNVTSMYLYNKFEP